MRASRSSPIVMVRRNADERADVVPPARHALESSTVSPAPIVCLPAASLLALYASQEGPVIIAADVLKLCLSKGGLDGVGGGGSDSRPTHFQNVLLVDVARTLAVYTPHRNRVMLTELCRLGERSSRATNPQLVFWVIRAAYVCMQFSCKPAAGSQQPKPRQKRHQDPEAWNSRQGRSYRSRIEA